MTKPFPNNYSEGVDRNFGAYLIQQGSKLASDFLKVVLIRSTKKAAAPEPLAPVEQKRAQAPTPPAALPSTPQKTPEAQKGTGCVPCTSDHLSTCSGALSEAVRFARTTGIENPEVQGRLALCVDELNIWERVDAAPEKQGSISSAEREFLHRWLPKGRGLRHQVNEVGSLEDLERAAASAQQQSREARTEMRKLRPPVMGKIEALAQRVKAGEISNKEALGQLSEWWGKQRPEKGG